MATGGGARPENNGDDVVEYEEAFEMLEKYSIISTSGLYPHNLGLIR